RKEEGLVMPPKENDKLSAGEVETIRRWIAAGAPWPEDSKTWTDEAGGVTVATSGGRTAEWTNRKYQPQDLWAYQPVRRPAVPDAAGKDTHPIDAFLQAKQRDKGIEKMAAPADKRTLIRRATFDLTGLPPTPEEVDAFQKDDSPQAFDRLLSR